jgi:hypothetical protein
MTTPGIYKLERYAGAVDGAGKPITTILPNSTRSTLSEAQRLASDKLAETGIVWDVVAG